MKPVLKWLGIGIASVLAVVLLFLLSGYLLPAEAVLEVEQTLEPSPEALFALFTTYDGVDRWWRQAARDMGDDFQVTHLAGPEAGAGMELGFGATGGGPPFERWSYTAVEPPVRVEIDVDFQIFRSRRVLELTPTGSGTRVHWRETARIASPVWRWMLKLNEASAVANRNTVLIAAGTAAGR